MTNLFSNLKDFIQHSMNLSSDALHVHLGLFLFVLGAALFRTDRRFVYAFAGVIAVCLMGEFLDLVYDYRRDRPLRWSNGAKDIFNTMLWPAILMVALPLVSRTKWSRSPTRERRSTESLTTPQSSVSGTL